MDIIKMAKELNKIAKVIVADSDYHYIYIGGDIHQREYVYVPLLGGPKLPPTREHWDNQASL